MGQQLHSPELSTALARIAGRGLDINTVIDVGASDGRWSEYAEKFWPRARFHLIEAFDHWRPALDALTARKPRFSYTLAAAGPKDGEIYFTNSKDDPFGGAAAKSSKIDQSYWNVAMVSLDSEVQRLKLPAPYLVKLDTHGFEREIIAGAQNTLRDTNLFINEFYNFESEERRWPQMVMLVESLGFRCVDVIDPLWRDYDNVFWQIDLAFIRSDRKEFTFSGFRSAKSNTAEKGDGAVSRGGYSHVTPTAGLWAMRRFLPRSLSVRKAIAAIRGK